MSKQADPVAQTSSDRWPWCVEFQRHAHTEIAVVVGIEAPGSEGNAVDRFRRFQQGHTLVAQGRRSDGHEIRMPSLDRVLIAPPESAEQTVPRPPPFSCRDPNASTKEKSSVAWQTDLWRCWPREEDWPARLDVYEAAAYLRISPDSIRRALILARDGRAKLPHQRVGSIYRIRRTDLNSLGRVEGRQNCVFL